MFKAASLAVKQKGFIRQLSLDTEGLNEEEEER